jgi:hypothetical protein
MNTLSNKYIYADYDSGKIWALTHNFGIVIDNELLIDTNFRIPSFGIVADSELYICTLDGNIYILSELVS